MGLSMLQRQIEQDSEKYFPEVAINPLYLACALAGEAGEICNDVKKWYRYGFDENFAGAEESGHLEAVKQELPDVLIYLCMMATHLGVDLQEEYEKKREHNNAKYLGRAAGTA